jgi:hypothetical protein
MIPLDFRRTALLALGLLWIVTLPVRASDPKAADEDPWNGKTRDEVVQKLGEPQKVKKAGRDGETLTYKFFRANPADIGKSGLRLIPVPGVGLVGVRAPGVGIDSTLAIGPTDFDKEGRPMGGGLSSSESVAGTYHPETGEMEIDTTGVGATPAGKIKLVFVLDAHGQVREWSASGKK